MKRLGLVISVLSILAISGCLAPVDTGGEEVAEVGGAVVSGKLTAHVCADPGPGEARCHAHVVVDHKGEPRMTSGPTGYNPADLQAAYGLPSSTAGSGQTVALVDAYDYPDAEDDLGVYRAQFGLPPCTTANGCFKKINQNGKTTNLPHFDTRWSQEAAIDIQVVSAICPNCKIILVEAKSSSLKDLGAGVNAAVAAGATVISNSYGGNESSLNAFYDSSYFDHPGVMITVSSGDSGYGVQYPAASQYVTAVGGTSLTRASGTSRGWTEAVWSGAGSGCSAYEPKPSWQHDTGCARRSVADVSAVADPNTGVSVYWTSQGSGGWMVFGGTSVASPLIAAVYALAGNGSTLTNASQAYANTASINDVTSGSNGSCGSTYLCTAGAGYDGPSGLGTPAGVGAF